MMIFLKNYIKNKSQNQKISPEIKLLMTMGGSAFMLYTVNLR